MTRFSDHDMTEEELRHLEDDAADSPRGESKPALTLPEPLYRLQVEHSHETFFAVYEETQLQSTPREPAAEVPVTEAANPEAAQAVEDTVSEAGDAKEAEGISPRAIPLDGDDIPTEEGPAASPGRLAPGMHVVASTRYGRDLCLVMGTIRNPGYVAPEEIVKIERIASASDMERRAQNKEKEEKAFSVCKERIAARNLPMKLISAHYLLEEPKVLFFFTADSRVDFRELVKDLVAVFKMRIELRQIGVRDEARVTGGCGVCGRVLCCHGVTDKLVPVSIKMAKDQNLSLNSMKISGPCGRLLCCLAYEYGFYREARRSIPPEGARFTWEGTLFRVTEINVPAGRVRISGEDGRVLVVEASRFVQSEGRWVLQDGAAEE